MRISPQPRLVLLAAVALVAVLLGWSPARAAPVGARSPELPRFNGSVYAVAFRGGIVYVGGDFTAATTDGRRVGRQRLAAFDARTGDLLDWAPTADRTVRALAVAGDAVYAAGDFGTVSGAARDAVAMLDADSGAVGGFAHELDGYPRALAVAHGRLYLGGDFTAVDGAQRTRLAAFRIGDGTLDDDWQPSADATVYTLATAGRRVYLGGSFHRTNEMRSTGRLTAVDAVSGDLVQGFRPQPTAVVYSVAADGRGVYAGLGGLGGRAESWTSGGRLRWSRTFDGDVQAVAALDGTAYVGGHFDRACTSANVDKFGDCSDDSRSRVKLAAIDADGDLSDWAPQANGVHGVRAIAASRALGALAVGGDFTMVGGATHHRIATFH
ncbi:hypothetical protein ACWT_0499 [Actinoplanes sp. SE50]|uniref:hypothetical protein n=1 Tax=unclassified Actinoplanes TaxID=2626549 RepID=UPI00023ECA6B|nr:MULTISPECIES: hypothetical protein [unclassified Actinoplanes]AEV81511.1 hypothetical protein ACPL_614 [Actinoplanes sp. SE50/110]ATO79914.1 hypothetical protein ACWT_0499 [Actinoplanes sp. SE50]SLL97316.1 hypothetical protein ACSP50_0517 [Actinoplanes sp. SE50/110]